MKKKLLPTILAIITLSLIITGSTYADENLNYSVTVEPALNITTSSNKVSLDLNPLNHDFDSQDLTVSVSTNNETGYKLYINTDSTKLVEKDDSNLYIETLSNEVSENDFVANRWGYRIGSGNYLPFVSGTLINSSKTQIENNSSTLTFAAKVGYETKAGTYALALNFQATANPHIPYMQNLDSTLCVTDGPITVIDSRDEEQYYVQRLADGKCWMLDNLRFSDSTVAVTSENSNAIYTASNPWYLPASSSGYSYDTKMINADYVDSISGDSSKNYGNGSHKYGVYYNYCAATAGDYCYANGQGAARNAEHDICPAGWHLPSGGSSGEYQTLYSKYSNINNFLNATSMPFSGYYYNDAARKQGEVGRYWTTTYSSRYYMYNFYFDSSAASNKIDIGRSDEYPVRCIRSN